MKQKLFYLFSFSVLCISLIIGCTQEEMILSENEKFENNSFQIFENQKNINARENNSLYYQNAFRDLYFLYYSENQENLPDFYDLSKPHIDFNYSSQVIYTEDSTRIVLFPVMVNSEVKEIIAASVNQKHDRVSFYFPEHDDTIEKAIDLFSTASKGRPGFDLDNPADIEEVVISVPPKTSFSIMPIEPFHNFPLPPTGGCGLYNNCGGGGGGSSAPVITPQISPCEKAKTAVFKANDFAAKQEFSGAKTAISGMNNGKENGMVFGGVNGNIVPTSIQTGSASNINLQHSFTYPFADMHNHTDVKPPSVGDFYSLIQANQQFATYGTRYIITANGIVYALAVTDTNAMNQFFANYPPSITPNPNGGSFVNFPPSLFSEWDDISFYNNDNKEMALAYILDAYNSGIALLKMDNNSNFKKINAEKSTVNGNTTYAQSNCP